VSATRTRRSVKKPAKSKGRHVSAKKTKKASAAPGKKKLRASYDAAQPDIDGDHWLWTDALNANAANSPEIRKVLRERAQYEADNNGYCGGLIERLGNDLIGTCPRLQLVIPGAAREAARQIEKAFAQWARRIGLGRKLRLMDNAAYVRGESFSILATNPALDPRGVQLDLRLYETDQVETPWLNWLDSKQFSGGKLDDFGNVTEWHFLKQHPGSDVWLGSLYDFDAIPANRVLHWYKPRRAGQLRGVPEILSSLSLYAYLRRYTLATVCAAETAANMAAILTTDNTNPNADEDPAANGVEVMDKIPIPRGAMLTAPAGWKPSQLKAEQPVTTYEAFKDTLLTEGGAAVGAPRNLSTNSSAAYNYSSGRLDFGMLYRRGIQVRRNDLTDTVLDRIAYAWLDEAALIPGLIPDGLRPVVEWTLLWRFDGFAAIDPEKEAKANDVKMRNGSATLAKVVGEDGDDWEEHLEQLAAEETRRAELGLPSLFASAAPSPAAPQPNEEPADAEDREAVAV
jgi:capsid protein